MGRAGAGSGGHRSSGGGHSVSRVSGGHRISGSSGSHSRAGSGSKISSGSSGSHSRAGSGSKISSGSSGSHSRAGSGSKISSGHSVSRVSGGHRISGSSGSHSRAGSGSKISSGSRSNAGSRSTMNSGGYMRRSTGRMSGGMYGAPPPPPPPRYRQPGTYQSYGNYSDCSVKVGTVFAGIIVLVILAAFVRGVVRSTDVSSNNNVKSTIVREKLDTKNAYINDCIIDELDWFNNTAKTSVQLKKFWEETGVQPYIILKSYDEALTTDDQKEQWTTDYYDANFDTENIFLYVYFAEEDTDNEVGYMAYANGFQTSTIMDEEAVNVFWNYLDRYWTSDMETDDVFIRTFNNTAWAIMHVSTTTNDLVLALTFLLIFLVSALIIVFVVKSISKHVREKAKEKERILNTPIEDIVSENLEDKYLK